LRATENERHTQDRQTEEDIDKARETEAVKQNPLVNNHITNNLSTHVKKNKQAISAESAL